MAVPAADRRLAGSQRCRSETALAPWRAGRVALAMAMAFLQRPAQASKRAKRVNASHVRNALALRMKRDPIAFAEKKTNNKLSRLGSAVHCAAPRTGWKVSSLCVAEEQSSPLLILF